MILVGCCGVCCSFGFFAFFFLFGFFPPLTPLLKRIVIDALLQRDKLQLKVIIRDTGSAAVPQMTLAHYFQFNAVTAYMEILLKSLSSSQFFLAQLVRAYAIAWRKKQICT